MFVCTVHILVASGFDTFNSWQMEFYTGTKQCTHTNTHMLLKMMVKKIKYKNNMQHFCRPFHVYAAQVLFWDLIFAPHKYTVKTSITAIITSVLCRWFLIVQFMFMLLWQQDGQHPNEILHTYLFIRIRLTHDISTKDTGTEYSHRLLRKIKCAPH